MDGYNASPLHMLQSAEAAFASDPEARETLLMLRSALRKLAPSRRRVNASVGNGVKRTTAEATAKELLAAIRQEVAAVTPKSEQASSAYREIERVFSGHEVRADASGHPLPRVVDPATAIDAGALDFRPCAAWRADAALQAELGIVSIAGSASASAAPSVAFDRSRDAADAWAWCGEIYALASRPGCYILPGCLTLAQQEYWMLNSLRRYIERPNRRNVDGHSKPAASTGDSAATDRLWQRYVEWASMADASRAYPNAALHSVSWSTLGYQYDWTSRAYHIEGDHDYHLFCGDAGAAVLAADVDAAGGAAAAARVESAISSPPPPSSRPSNPPSASSLSAASSPWYAPFPPELASFCSSIVAHVNAAVSAHVHYSQPRAAGAVQLDRCATHRVCGEATLTEGAPAAPAAPREADNGGGSACTNGATEAVDAHGLPMSLDCQAGIVNLYRAAVVAAPVSTSASLGAAGATSTVIRHDYVPHAPKIAMGGHRDDLERTMAHPVLSISLGCPAVFLIGCSTKDAKPVPVLLRSGDVVIMAGDCRLAYHGVPQVFPCRCTDTYTGMGSSSGAGAGAEESDGSGLLAHADPGHRHHPSARLSCTCSAQIPALFAGPHAPPPPMAASASAIAPPDALVRPAEPPPDDSESDVAAACRSPDHGDVSAAERRALRRYVRSTRININVRQVVPVPVAPMAAVPTADS